MEGESRVRYTGPLKAVILDWAGTTVDYGCFAPARVFIDVFKRNGVSITMDQAREPMGVHKKVHIRQISTMEDVVTRWKEVNGSRPTEEDVEAMFQEFIPLQTSCLRDYADLVPGTLEAVAEFRKRGLKIGSTTGYTTEMMELLLKEAKKRGYTPDSSVCSTMVLEGRPAPWMCFENAKNLGIYPMEAIVKVGDTLPDIHEGLNAGMWSVGVTKTGNEMGMTEEEIAALDPGQREALHARAYARMIAAGAHYAVESIADMPSILDDINARLATGERP
jgi:phosphonoacetaldehyde hydrolase